MKGINKMIQMKRLLYFLFFLVLTSAATAQNFYGGLLGGFSASQIEGDYYKGYNKLGATFGSWVQFDLGDNLMAGMELKFNQKGSYKRPTKLDTYKFSYQLNYIDLPVLIGYQYASTVSVFTGLSFNYLINRSANDNFGPVDLTFLETVSPWEVGLLLGVRSDFNQLVKKPWADKFALDIRFQYSLLSIDTPHRFFIGNRYYGLFNNSITTTLYYRVDFAK